MPDQLTQDIERDLRALGHLEVLDPACVPRACLDRRSLLYFRASCRNRLEAWSVELKGAAPTAAALALRGRIYWLLGRDARARRCLGSALRLQPNCPEALAYHGVLLIKTEPKKAVEVLRAAVDAAPGRARTHLWLAAARMRIGSSVQVRLALEDLERGRAHAPSGDFLFALLRTTAYLKLSRYRDVLEASQELIAASGSGSAGHGARAAARLALGDWSGAFSDCNEARNRDPDCGFDIADSFLRGAAGRQGREFLRGSIDALVGHPMTASFYAVRAELRRGPAFCRYDLALEDYRRAEALDPGCAWIQAQMARAEAHSAGARKALRRLDRAAALRPDAGWIYSWRGEVKRLLGREAAAVTDFERGLRLMPWYGYAYAWKGAVLTRQRRWPQALEALSAALDLKLTDPALPLAYYNRGLCRRALGDLEGALKDVSAAHRRSSRYEWKDEKMHGDAVLELNGLLKKNPRQAWAYAWRGRIRAERGDCAGAAEDFSSALALRPSTAIFRTWRGMALRKLGRTAQARAEFSRALRLGGGRGLPAICLAEMEIDQGRVGQALALLRASGDNGIDASFFLNKARLLLRAAKGREALACVQRAAALYPGYGDVHARVSGLLLP